MGDLLGRDRHGQRRQFRHGALAQAISAHADLAVVAEQVGLGRVASQLTLERAKQCSIVTQLRLAVPLEHGFDIAFGHIRLLTFEVDIRIHPPVQ